MSETPTPWMLAPFFPDYIIPAADAHKRLGGASDDEINKREFAQVVAMLRPDRHGRSDHKADARLIVAAVNSRAALIAALEGCERVLAAMHKDGWKVGGDVLRQSPHRPRRRQEGDGGMKPSTLKALKASIKHWEANAAAVEPDAASLSASDCALCMRFYELYGVCNGCPVMERTGKELCRKTPYTRAIGALDAWHAGGTGTKFRAVARAELDFLKSLLPTKAKP
jgi:hypothetical protein